MWRLAGHPLGRFERPRRRLRASLVQLLCAVAGLLLGLLLPRLTVGSTVASSRVAEALVGVGFGVLGLVLSAVGLYLNSEYEDEGQNHYFDAFKSGIDD